MNANSHPRHRHLPALSVLFARYVSGQINDAIWEQISRLLDAEDTTPDERMGLVNFISDAWDDLGLDAVDLPKLDEIQDLLIPTRIAA
jgi:hypothetical protein